VTPELSVLALRFYAERLMSKQLCRNIKVRLIFKSGLLKTDRLEAQCIWEDDNFRPREFMVTVDRDLSRRKVLMSLAHEAVHIKQYATGQLKHHMREPNPRWMNKQVNDDLVPYSKLPWEEEAWSRELELYREFLKIRRKVCQ
jgi:hypothetical protein